MLVKNDLRLTSSRSGVYYRILNTGV